MSAGSGGSSLATAGEASEEFNTADGVRAVSAVSLGKAERPMSAGRGGSSSATAGVVIVKFDAAGGVRAVSDVGLGASGLPMSVGNRGSSSLLTGEAVWRVIAEVVAAEISRTRSGIDAGSASSVSL